MPALPKPHRIGVIEPAILVEGADAVLQRETALLLWVAMIEACLRHPGLAVYDAESTPLVPVDGHFAPQHAGLGVSPTDAFWTATRRDELVWLELAPLRAVEPKPAADAPVRRARRVCLHSLAFDGTRQQFDAPATGGLGDQIDHVLAAWLAARQLPPLPKRFEAVTVEGVLAVVRSLAPVLADHARSWTAPVRGGWAEAADDDRDELSAITSEPVAVASGERLDAREISPDPLGEVTLDTPDVPGGAPDETKEHALELPGVRSPTARLARAAANRLPPGLRVAALRVLELALREPLGDVLLAADRDHPQSLFDRFLGKLERRRDFALLRRVIAAAPGWARPYTELAYGVHDDVNPDDPFAPSPLETVAGAAIAALLRPGHFEVIERAAAHLRDDGRPDEALRVLERGVSTTERSAGPVDAADGRATERDPRAHLALLALHPACKRPAAWLAQAKRSARSHGCPTDPTQPRYPDQLQIDLQLSDALVAVGRLDEAIALRANRLDGRALDWPRHARALASWRTDVRHLAWAYAREGHYRGDPAHVVEGFAEAEPRDSLEVAFLLDALVALGREADVPLAWAQHGLGRGHDGAIARLAAARGLLAAGEWRRGLEEVWRVELGDPGRDDQVAIARCGLLLSCMPIDVAETALAERVAAGANGLARRMARIIADFVPAASGSSIVMRALGSSSTATVDPSSLAAFGAAPAMKRAVDALFADLAGEGPLLLRADRFVDRWFEVAHAAASEADPTQLAHAAAYVAAQSLARYFAAVTAMPTPLAGALRTVASESLALVHAHREHLADRDARALLGVIEPLLRRVDRWLGVTWLGVVERACALDERSGGELGGFARDHATVAARVLGPEEVAVLAASVARMHRERLDGWESATAAQGMRLALHTGHVGTDELADAVMAQLDKRAIDSDDAIDALQTAAYLAEGRSAVPAIRAARVLVDAGRGAAALAVLLAGLAAADDRQRDRALDELRDAFQREHPQLPMTARAASAATLEAIRASDLVRAERLGRWAIALEPGGADHHRLLAEALAAAGKLPDALHQLTRSLNVRSAMPRESSGNIDVRDATTALADALQSAGRITDAAIIRDFAYRSRDPSSAIAGPRASTLDAAAAVAFQLLSAGDFAAAAAMLSEPSWRASRAALTATRFRTSAERYTGVPSRAAAAAAAILVATDGHLERDAILCRISALEIRAAAHFPREPVPVLGERTTREAFERELKARRGVVVEDATVAPTPFVDRVIVAGSKVSSASDYVALLEDLGALSPAEALAQFDLDGDGYLEIGRAWQAAMAADPSIAPLIAAGLAKR